MPASAQQRFRGEVIRTRDLPAAPTSLVAVLQITDPDDHARALVALVESDPAIHAKVLRLANGTILGQRRKVASVDRALVLLGFRTMRNLVLAMSVWDELARGTPERELDALWRHSVLVGRLSHELARSASADADAAFGAGLLHDAGRLLLASHFGAAYWAALDPSASGSAVVEAERAAFDVDHARVGGWLFEAWALPQPVVRAVQEHHDAAPVTPLGRTVGAADRLAHTDAEADPEAHDAAAVYAAELLGIRPEVVLDAAAAIAGTDGG